MADRKDRMALLSRYSTLHKSRYGEKPSLNINVEQWAADALIDFYGMPECYDILSYYFEAVASPSWKHFAYRTEDIINARKRIEQDLAEREERKRMARAWLNE
jgi:hypothetical protein